LNGYIIDIASDINADINNNVPYKFSAESCQEAAIWNIYTKGETDSGS